MYRAGETVIVTQDGVNKVGVVLDTFLHNKSRLYDVLLENRSAICSISAAPKAKTRINKALTTQLVDSGNIVANIPYKELVERELLPYIKS